MSHWQNVIKAVSQLCDRHQLLTQQQRLLIAVSGGPDSTFLVHCLGSLAKQYALEIHLAHVNYQQRGEDSEQDEEFVRQLAEQGPYPLHRHHCRWSDENQSGNFQDWARQERYRFFDDCVKKHRLSAVAVAHHLNDQSETFFLRILRGSGPSGLTGMAPSSRFNGLHIIRPLLKVAQSDILTALKEQGQGYRIDNSNRDTKYRRNHLRHEILPELRRLQPEFERQLAETLEISQAEDTYLNELADLSLQKALISKESHEHSYSAKSLRSLPKVLLSRSLKRLIGELTAGPQNITFHHINKVTELITKGGNAQYALPGRLSFEQGPLVIKISKLVSE